VPTVLLRFNRAVVRYVNRQKRQLNAQFFWLKDSFMEAKISRFPPSSIALAILFWAYAAHAFAASPIVATLAISSGGKGETSVASGNVITLTAAVSARPHPAERRTSEVL
jgi:hypothetical protein